MNRHVCKRVSVCDRERERETVSVCETYVVSLSFRVCWGSERMSVHAVKAVHVYVCIYGFKQYFYSKTI